MSAPTRYSLAIYNGADIVSHRICRTAREALLRALPAAQELKLGARVRIEIGRVPKSNYEDCARYGARP